MKFFIFILIMTVNNIFCTSTLNKKELNVSELFPTAEKIIKRQNNKYGTKIIPYLPKKQCTLYSLLKKGIENIANNKKIFNFYTSGESPFES